MAGADVSSSFKFARAPPGQIKKIGGPNVQGEVVSAPPQTERAPFEAESNFLKEIVEIWAAGEVIWAVLASVVRATTKKGRQLFGEEKCTLRPVFELPGG